MPVSFYGHFLFLHFYILLQSLLLKPQKGLLLLTMGETHGNK
jgi:hypothetical protein